MDFQITFSRTIFYNNNFFFIFPIWQNLWWFFRWHIYIRITAIVIVLSNLSMFVWHTLRFSNISLGISVVLLTYSLGSFTNQSYFVMLGVSSITARSNGLLKSVRCVCNKLEMLLNYCKFLFKLSSQFRKKSKSYVGFNYTWIQQVTVALLTWCL